MTFIVNEIDFSKCVQESTYAVDSQPVFESWKDANGRNHREIIRERIAGSFEMVFVEGMNSSYADFLSAVNSATKAGVLETTLTVNNQNTTATIECFCSIAFSSVLAIADGRSYRRCTISIEEC